MYFMHKGPSKSYRFRESYIGTHAVVVYLFGHKFEFYFMPNWLYRIIHRQK